MCLDAPDLFCDKYFPLYEEQAAITLRITSHNYYTIL